MGLSVQDRGFLEKTIDKGISNIPGLIKRCRSAENKQKFQIKEPNDFVFGVIFGEILEGFSNYYVLVNNMPPSSTQIDEAVTVLNNRTAEIRNAIFNCG